MNKSDFKTSTRTTRDSGQYSKEYLRIKEQAETIWPAWKVKLYNDNFATSKHAKKIKIK